MRKKKIRFDAFAQLPNCVAEPLAVAGVWQQQFAAAAPLWLELGAGKAYFALALARMHPQWNVLAMDTKRERLCMGAQQAVDEQVQNLRCVWGDGYILDRMFAPAELDGIWITFPDPFPKDRHARRRLTAPYFWELYRKVLKPGGQVHFKTDDPDLFAYSLEVLAEQKLPLMHCTHDLYAEAVPPYVPATLPTAFEQRWLAEGRKIHYLAVQLP